MTDSADVPRGDAPVPDDVAALPAPAPEEGTELDGLGAEGDASAVRAQGGGHQEAPAAAPDEAARQEAARQEAARQEAARQEAARQEAARQQTCPGPGCDRKNPYAFDRVCIRDYRELRREAVLGGNGKAVADAVLMQSKACGTVWLKVETDGATRRVVLVLDTPAGTVSHEETDTFMYTPMVRVNAGSPLTGRVRVYSMDGTASVAADIRASS